jgi:hypothetical protein
MSAFDFSDEKGVEGLSGAVKQATKNTVKSVAAGVNQQVKAGGSDFFAQLMPDLFGQGKSASAEGTGDAPSLSQSSDSGVEQPDTSSQQQTSHPTQTSASNISDSSYQGIRTPEEKARLDNVQQQLEALKKQHKEIYSNEFSDTETLLKKQEEKKKQEEQQKLAAEEEEKKEKAKKEQQKKSEQEQVQAMEERKNKYEKMPGAG